MMEEKELKYLDLSDEEVELRILERLREMKQVLREIRNLLKSMGGESYG